MTHANVIASLDLACFLNVVMARRGALTSKERDQARTYVVRALAALNGRSLPGDERVDHGTALAAFATVCEAVAVLGVPNSDMVACFNNDAWRRRILEGANHERV